MTSIMPCLWFNNRIDEAVDFYLALFADAKVTQRVRRDAHTPSFTAVIELAGQRFMLLNGSGQEESRFPFSEATSFVIECADQTEVDHFWNGFVDNGGAESQCGWCRDKFGLSWQVVPVQLYQTVGGPDLEAAGRATAAMMKMKKLIVADLEKAYHGD